MRDREGERERERKERERYCARVRVKVWRALNTDATYALELVMGRRKIEIKAIKDDRNRSVYAVSAGSTHQCGN